MSRFDSIIFDLDGTLWDSCPAVAVAWNNVVQRLGIAFRPITPEQVRAVCGKSHHACIEETFSGLSPQLIQKLSDETMVEDIRMIRELGGVLYAGVLEGLQMLKPKYKLFIVSNCQAGYIETFLKLNGLVHDFIDFECWGNTGNSKTQNLKNVIARNELKAPLFVGDAEGDHKAARDNKISFAFASYGFGQVPDYDFKISNFSELLSKV